MTDTNATWLDLDQFEADAKLRTSKGGEYWRASARNSPDDAEICLANAANHFENALVATNNRMVEVIAYCRSLIECERLLEEMYQNERAAKIVAVERAGKATDNEAALRAEFAIAMQEQDAALARIKTLEKVLGTILPKLPCTYNEDRSIAFSLREIEEWRNALSSDAQAQAEDMRSEKSASPYCTCQPEVDGGMLQHLHGCGFIKRHSQSRECRASPPSAPQPDPRDELIKELASTLKLAADFLDFCGYGDSYERECAQAHDLPDKIAETLANAASKGLL